MSSGSESEGVAGGRRGDRGEHHSEGGRASQGGGRGGDLASKSLMFETKRFYMDVKENVRGRFIKFAEISMDGRKNQILMSMSTASKFSQALVDFIDCYDNLEELNPSNLLPGEIKSEVIIKDDKKFHIDLKENARGRFLKVSETLTRGYSRFQIFIPAEGLREFQSNLEDLIDQFGNESSNNDNDNSNNISSSGRERGGNNSGRIELRIENKTFTFDARKNTQGRYVIVTEIKGNYRNAILVPESGWEAFRDAFEDVTKAGNKDE